MVTKPKEWNGSDPEQALNEANGLAQKRYSVNIFKPSQSSPGGRQQADKNSPIYRSLNDPDSCVKVVLINAPEAKKKRTFPLGQIFVAMLLLANFAFLFYQSRVLSYLGEQTENLDAFSHRIQRQLSFYVKSKKENPVVVIHEYKPQVTQVAKVPKSKTKQPALVQTEQTSLSENSTLSFPFNKTKNKIEKNNQLNNKTSKAMPGQQSDEPNQANIFSVITPNNPKAKNTYSLTGNSGAKIYTQYQVSVVKPSKEPAPKLTKPSNEDNADYSFKELFEDEQTLYKGRKAGK